MIDLNKAKKRMEEIQRGRIDFSRLSYSIKEGETTIRFILKEGQDFPFMYGAIYYKIQKPFFVSPEYDGSPDPIMEALQLLMKTGNEEDAVFAKKHFPSKRVFALGVVREQEDKGAVWIDFPHKVEKEIMKYLFNEEYLEMQVEKLKTTGEEYNPDVLDITHPIYGVDFVITKKKGAQGGFPEYSVAPRKLTNPFSKLAKTQEQIDEIIENTPDFKDAYKHYSYDEIKAIWEKYLSGDESTADGADEDGEIVEDEKVDVSAALAKFKNKKFNK